MLYPKLNSLYKREGCGAFDETNNRYESDLQKKPRRSPLILGEYACQEFEAINRWTVTEKVDGTNVRIILDRQTEVEYKKLTSNFGVSLTRNNVPGRLSFQGRTNNAQFPCFLLDYLQKTFNYEQVSEVFKESNYTVLFGEGYGPKIQSGSYYRKDPSFILFDVFCSGWWLGRDAVNEVAQQLGIDSVPVISKRMQIKYSECKYGDVWTTQEVLEYVRDQPRSIIAEEGHVSEGIVARAEPVMMFRKGGPIMFKLKCKDLKEV
jgi:hypothetical protein